MLRYCWNYLSGFEVKGNLIVFAWGMSKQVQSVLMLEWVND